MKLVGSVAAAASLVLLAAPPAHACSFSWKPGYSPKEIRTRSDVRKIRGVFRVTEMRGSADENGALDEGWIYGRIETRRGTHWDTIQRYSRFAAECGAFRGPVADSEGFFWIELQREAGRYPLLLWEGKKLPRQDGQAAEKTEKH